MTNARKKTPKIRKFYPGLQIQITRVAMFDPDKTSVRKNFENEGTESKCTHGQILSGYTNSNVGVLLTPPVSNDDTKNKMTCHQAS